ncbi:hypothetical protein IP81_15655 [Novosphingobium sp. AAP83]|uniref:DUF6508 domain-containing protein n=1 Tax=Novosphingobium sp. AAP83 TaxID=1523425 RepID=UPI0006B89CB7|nr:DUF6508 domain-containing protein [Novosphingobium sp. AAP83]KPF90306.1 hypothetical protein IP81_15655 [Novosphingobium sp. AAP83]
MGDINTSYYTGKAATGRLHKLGAFYNTFRQPWFSFVEDSTPLIIGYHIDEDTLEYHDVVIDFIRTCLKDKWVIAGFDWHEWAENDGAAYFADMGLMMEAEALDLAKVSTVIFGREHANHGYLVEAYANGLLLTVLKRAQGLSAFEPLQEVAFPINHSI